MMLPFWLGFCIGTKYGNWTDYNKLWGWVSNSTVCFQFAILTVIFLCCVQSIKMCEMPQKYMRILYITFFVFAFALPICLAFAIRCYYSRFINTHGTAARQDDRSAARSKNKRVTCLMLILNVAFAVLWFPLLFHLLLFEFTPYNPTYLCFLVMFYVMAYAMALVFPVIYAIFPTRYTAIYKGTFLDRVYLRRICCCWGRRLEGREETEMDTVVTSTARNPSIPQSQMPLLVGQEVDGQQQDVQEKQPDQVAL